MTTQELIERIDSLLPQLEDDSSQVVTLTSISNLAEGLLSAVTKYFAEQTTPNQHSANVLIDKAIADLRKLRHSQVNDTLVEMRRLFFEFYSGATDPSDQTLAYYNARLTDVRNAYDDFLSSHSKGDALRLTMLAARLVTSLRTDREALRLIRNNLIAPPPDEKKEQISIYFKRPMSVVEITVKLADLTGLYSECCNIVGASADEEPLQPVRIESGSLWMIVLGSAVAMRLLSEALRAATAFSYRNYTSEGRRRTGIAERMDAVQLMASLAGGLKERGLDDSKINSRLQAASERLATQLSKFVGTDELNVRTPAAASKPPQLPRSEQKLLP
jgi:hypothetical protein